MNIFFRENDIKQILQSYLESEGYKVESITVGTENVSPFQTPTSVAAERNSESKPQFSELNIQNIPMGFIANTKLMVIAKLADKE